MIPYHYSVVNEHVFNSIGYFMKAVKSQPMGKSNE